MTISSFAGIILFKAFYNCFLNLKKYFLPPAPTLEFKHSCSSVLIVSREGFIRQWGRRDPEAKTAKGPERTLGPGPKN
jgi:hypothetical protein